MKLFINCRVFTREGNSFWQCSEDYSLYGQALGPKGQVVSENSRSWRTAWPDTTSSTVPTPVAAGAAADGTVTGSSGEPPPPAK